MDDNKLDKAVQETAHYLYVIEDSAVMGEIDPKLYQAIAMLRQLINEEFKPQKLLSSQFIYDIMNPAFRQLLTKARYDEIEMLPNNVADLRKYLPKRRAELNKTLEEENHG